MDILKDLNLPGFFHDGSSIVKNNVMSPIEDDVVVHEDTTIRLPINKGLLNSGELKRGDDNFESGNLIVMDGHYFFSFSV